MIFKDRVDAGQALGERLLGFAAVGPLVYGVARGGVIVAAEVALAIGGRLDVLAPRKLPHPDNEEVAIGAVAEDGAVFLDDWVRPGGTVSQIYIDTAGQEAAAESARRVALYRDGRAPLPATGQTVILVDDGIATGLTLLAAAAALSAQRPQKLVIAVPVAPTPIPQAIRRVADELVVLTQPQPFYAVGQAYARFSQTTDEEVLAAMRRVRKAGTLSG